MEKSDSRGYILLVLTLVAGLLLVFGLLVWKIEILANLSANPSKIRLEQKQVETFIGEVYFNSRYKYHFRLPKGLKVSNHDLESSLDKSSNLNIRSNSYDPPYQSGFDIRIQTGTNGRALVEMCKDVGTIPWLDNRGFICDESVKHTEVEINGVRWEKILGGSVGVVPSAYVRYSTLRGGNLFLVIEWGSSYSKEVEEVVKTFVFDR